MLLMGSWQPLFTDLLEDGDFVQNTADPMRFSIRQTLRTPLSFSAKCRRLARRSRFSPTC